jgi:serine/threonine protein kinase
MSSQNSNRKFLDKGYEVARVIGRGGFGLVYLAYSHELKKIVALKTFREELFRDTQARLRFRQEAEIWVAFGIHPYIVTAFFVEEINHQPYLVMEFIPRNDGGLNSLEDYLRRAPPNLVQALRWSIEFCYGMEHAYNRGMRCHRDIKPANILIDLGGSVRISDFGLASTLGFTESDSPIDSIERERVGLSRNMNRRSFGTPTHMSPEQFRDAEFCDQRSDIYSFGVTLYQMAAAGRLPFLAKLPRDNSISERARFWLDMERLHSEYPVPTIDAPLSTVVERALEKNPKARFHDFQELRGELERILSSVAGERVTEPEAETERWEIHLNIGTSLLVFGRFDESLGFLDKALHIDPRRAVTWSNKGICLSKLGRLEEAISCYDKALELDPASTRTWTDKATDLLELRRYEEAIHCSVKALELDRFHIGAWITKGEALTRMGRFEESENAFSKALEINPKNIDALLAHGNLFVHMGADERALVRFQQVTEMDPFSKSGWWNRGLALWRLGRSREAVDCFTRILEQDAAHERAWHWKGAALLELKRYDEALQCLSKAVEIDPLDTGAHLRKAFTLAALGRLREANDCIKLSVKLGPKMDGDRELMERVVDFVYAKVRTLAANLGKEITCPRCGTSNNATAEYCTTCRLHFGRIHNPC